MSAMLNGLAAAAAGLDCLIKANGHLRFAICDLRLKMGKAAGFHSHFAIRKSAIL
jgi:hypothetical protein